MINLQVFEANAAGRDFVVGDLHGCYGQLQRALSGAGFDPAIDRLFCAGDLVDRGPDSLACLRLIREPWFHTVIGNHEILLLNYLGFRDDGISNETLMTYTAPWVDRVVDREELMELAYALLERPLCMRVSHQDGNFNVAHAELRSRMTGEVIQDADIEQHLDFDAACWNRKMSELARLMHHDLVRKHGQREDATRKILVLPNAMSPGLSLTYVGHEILNYPMLYRSHLYIDRGAHLAEPDLSDRLWLIEHANLMHELRHAGEMDIRALQAKPQRHNPPQL